MRKEIKIAFTLAIVIVLGNSLTNTYFAPLALEKGINESIVGMIISIYSMTILIITPIFTDIINSIGRKKVFFMSIFLQVSF